MSLVSPLSSLSGADDGAPASAAVAAAPHRAAVAATGRAEAPPRPLVVTGTGIPRIVAVRGDVDAANGAELQSQIAMLPDCDTIVDLVGLQFCSGGCLELLLDYSARLAQSGAALRLAACPPSLHSIIERLGLQDALPVYASVAEAKAEFLRVIR
ncbi:STAS domain-containing protein [Tomitella cavernea]|uniref:STAS domain-containing protein n=1 Tax=Tomitella cavernea TaxID=1387982 RepID=A0ABP9CZK1_9ACTN|nr:STAS domain-containing protein [Tomitella cavernea]